MIGPSKSKQILILLSLLSYTFLFNHAFTSTKKSPTTNTLTQKIHSTLNSYPHLSCGVYIKPNWSNNEININGNKSFPAASLIKIPIAVVLLQEIDKGNISWNTTLTLKKADVVPGSGTLKTKKIGSKHRLKEVFRLMLTISDNTATNMIIDLLGGVNSCNKKISLLGLKNTKLSTYIYDLKGANQTTPYDMVIIMDKALEGNLLSNSSKRVLKNALLDVENDSLIKKGLGKYTKFAHKTGTIGICVGDAGIIYLSFKKNIGISVIVKRPFNDLKGKEVIKKISNIVYKELLP